LLVCSSGSPAIPITPFIWGQNAGYLYVQLRDFKLATRASEHDGIMHAITQPLSEAQLLAIAEYVSAQPWPEFWMKRVMHD
jgi:cytochrome c553